MPTQGGHAFSGGLHQAACHLRVVQTSRFQVDPHTAHASGVHGAKFAVAGVLVNHRHATRAVAQGVHALQGVHGAAVVAALRRSLHHHDATDAQALVQSHQVFDRSGTRGVGAIGPQRKTVKRAKHMHMAIAGQRRHGVRCGMVVSFCRHRAPQAGV